MLIGLALIHQMKSPAPNFSCGMPSKVFSATADSPLDHDIVLTASDGTGQTDSLLNAYCREMHVSVKTEGGTKVLYRSADDQKKTKEELSSAIVAGFASEEARYEGIAQRNGQKLGSPELAYKYLQSYEDDVAANRANKDLPLPRINPTGLNPLTVCLIAYLKNNIQWIAAKAEPYKTAAFSNMGITGMDALQSDLQPYLTGYNDSGQAWNSYLANYGQPSGLKKIFPDRKERQLNGKIKLVPTTPQEYFLPQKACADGSIAVLKCFVDSVKCEISLRLYSRQGQFEALADLYFPLKLSSVPLGEHGPDHLTISDSSASYLGFVSQIPLPTDPNQAVEAENTGQPVVLPDIRNSPSAYMKPTDHEPLSYFTADLLQSYAKNLGFNAVEADIPDSLFVSFKRLLNSNPKPTVAQVSQCLRDCGVSTTADHNVLVLNPVSVRASEETRGDRKSLQDVLQETARQGFAGIRTICRAECANYMKYPYYGVSFILLRLALQQDRANHLDYDAIQPLLLALMGSLTDGEWSKLLDSVTVHSTETPRREQLVHDLYGDGTDIGQAAISTGAGALAASLPETAFSNGMGEDFPVTFAAVSEPALSCSMIKTPKLVFHPTAHTTIMLNMLAFPFSLAVDPLSVYKTLVHSNHLEQFPKISAQLYKKYFKFKLGANFNVSVAANFGGGVTKALQGRWSTIEPNIVTFDELPKEMQNILIYGPKDQSSMQP